MQHEKPKLGDLVSLECNVVNSGMPRQVGIYLGLEVRGELEMLYYMMIGLNGTIQHKIVSLWNITVLEHAQEDDSR
jgi:hypothetical protein